MASAAPPINGLAMLQAASVALADALPDTVPSAPSTCPASPSKPAPTPTSLSALLNPAPTGAGPSLPPGFVLGKDGKIKKKRGRKPTPGLTDEDRRQARLLKNRRTAEISRRRKLAMLNRLTEERDHANRVVGTLRSSNEYLIHRLATALGTSVASLVKNDPTIAASSRVLAEPPQSDVSSPPSVVDSDDEGCLIAVPNDTPTCSPPLSAKS